MKYSNDNKGKMIFQRAKKEIFTKQILKANNKNRCLVVQAFLSEMLHLEKTNNCDVKRKIERFSRGQKQSQMDENNVRRN